MSPTETISETYLEITSNTLLSMKSLNNNSLNFHSASFMFIVILVVITSDKYWKIDTCTITNTLEYK